MALDGPRGEDLKRRGGQTVGLENFFCPGFVEAACQCAAVRAGVAETQVFERGYDIRFEISFIADAFAKIKDQPFVWIVMFERSPQIVPDGSAGGDVSMFLERLFDKALDCHNLLLCKNILSFALFDLFDNVVDD